MPFELITNPLIEAQIAIFLDKKSNISECEHSLGLASLMMAIEFEHYLNFGFQEIETITSKEKFPALVDKITLMPILRSGLSMISGFKKVFPFASVSHVILSRNSLEEIIVNKLYYSEQILKNKLILMDPIIGTGLSINVVVDYLLSKGISLDRINIVSLMATPQGIEKITNHCDKIKLFVCYLAKCLENMANTFPRQGNAGPRIFGL